jgi:hypothetical protein
VAGSSPTRDLSDRTNTAKQAKLLRRYDMSTIQWHHDYEEGLLLTKKAKKPLFLDFFKAG